MNAPQSRISKPPVVARLMLPNDANPAGNIHGGTILQMMEQAGAIAATRFCNRGPDSDSDSDDDEFRDQKVAFLASMDNMSFYSPMYVGEVAALTAEVVFTSDRSALVKVVVTAEDVVKGKTRITNSGRLWYLSTVPPLDGATANFEPLSVPQISPPSPQVQCGEALAEYEEARHLYEARKRKKCGSDAATDGNSCPGFGRVCLCPTCRESYHPPPNGGGHSPLDLRQTLCQVVNPGDCGFRGKLACGGFVMKLMDSASGCAAIRHCCSNVVTASISTMEFTAIVCLGDVVTVHATPTFASSRSMEIAATASVTSSTRKDVIVARGFFTFVTIDRGGKVGLIPPLIFHGEADFCPAFAGQIRYEESKKARLALKKKGGN